MATQIGRIGPSPYSLLDRRRRLRWSNCTGPLDPVETKAARSDSVPTMMVAAGNVTILSGSSL